MTRDEPVGMVCPICGEPPLFVSIEFSAPLPAARLLQIGNQVCIDNSKTDPATCRVSRPRRRAR